MALVSFDFDDTLTIGVPGSRCLPNFRMINLLRHYADMGHMIAIVTYRNRENENRDWIWKNEPYRAVITEFILDHRLPVNMVHYTNHTSKGPVLSMLGADIHYDDDPVAVEEARKFGVKAIHVLGEEEEWVPEEL